MDKDGLQRLRKCRGECRVEYLAIWALHLHHLLWIAAIPKFRRTSFGLGLFHFGVNDPVWSNRTIAAIVLYKTYHLSQGTSSCRSVERDAYTVAMIIHSPHPKRTRTSLPYSPKMWPWSIETIYCIWVSWQEDCELTWPRLFLLAPFSTAFQNKSTFSSINISVCVSFTPGCSDINETSHTEKGSQSTNHSDIKDFHRLRLDGAK